MAECSVCGDEINMPYSCTYCGRTHCGTHKLPEKHECPNLAQANTLGPELRQAYQTTPSSSTSKLPDRRVWIAAAVVLVGAIAVLLLL